MDKRAVDFFEDVLDRYAEECSNMRDREVVLSLLEAYALRKGDCQLGALLYSAKKMLEEQDMHP